MKIISEILYFLSHHASWSFFIILFLCVLLSIRKSIRRKKPVCIIFGFVTGFCLSMANIFVAHMLNAWFLNGFGERGTATIIQAKVTNSTLNDEYVMDYDVVIKTPQGKDYLTSFSTMSAAIYPVRNGIYIPPVSELFLVKYIPGVEKNIVILSDESLYGKRRKIYENRQPVEKAGRLYEASPQNMEFKKEYLNALKTFIENSDNAIDTININNYREISKELESTP